MLLAEYVFVSVSFNADALRGRGGWLSGLGLLDPLGSALLAVVAASLLAGAAVSRTGTAELAALLRSRHSLRGPLLVHAFAFACFVGLTGYVFGASFATTRAGTWVAIWAALAATVLMSAVAIALPMRSLAMVVARMRRPLAIGAGVGLFAWIAGRTTGELWWVLSRFTFDAAAGLLRLAGQQVVADPDHFELGIGDYAVTIAPSCAGYEGIGVIVVFLAAFLWLERSHLRFPRAWLLLPLGIVGVLAANVLRIAVLIGVGRWVSAAIAEGGFHSKAGWALYCAIALGIAAAARRSRLLRREPARQADDTWNPTAVYLGPLLALIATALVTGMASAGFDYFYPLRVVAVAAVLWAYRGAVPLAASRRPWDSIALGGAVFVMWLGLEPRPDLSHVAAWRTQLDAMPPPARTAWLGLRVLGSVITVPIAEELAFRGFLLRRLVASDFTRVSPRTLTWPSLVLSSLAFGALHQRWIAGTIAGLCYACAQLRRGRLGDAIIAHAVTNALIAADVLLFGAWWLWL